MIEDDVLKQIRCFLEVHGAFVMRVIERVPKCYSCGCYLGTSEAGIPDLIGWFPAGSCANPSTSPVHFFIECKAPGGGNKRVKQKEFIERARTHNILAFFAPSLKIVHEIFTAAGLKLAAI